ncbi:MAG TPA: hypothetical protein VFS88_01885 [Micavibrio sp.]|nr:hypothetical protein [Micavibrio sp.]
MSAAIRTSLNKLNNAVHKLESAIESRKAAAAAAPKKATAGAGQNDLFSAMTASQQPTSMNPMNVRMLAKRLDSAIKQVETILKEGRG